MTTPRAALPAFLVLLLIGCASREPEPPSLPEQRTEPRFTPVARTVAATPLDRRPERVPDPANLRYDRLLYGGLEWDWVGPQRGGRVTAVTGVPGRPGHYYFGASGGGVWKTLDYGETWFPVSDGFFETPSIGAIRVAPSNPDVVWVSTGSDGLRSNVITGLGVYRSTDAGASWRFVGLRDVGNTGAIEVHPENPDVAYVAAIGHPFGPNPARGVYRTRDAGETWEQVLFISDSTGMVDVEIDPTRPDLLYSSSWRGERRPWTIISGSYEGGVYRSEDGGDTWTKLEGGLPTAGDVLFGKIDLALSPTDPRVVYALIEATEPHDGLYRSEDGGETWEHVSSENYLLGRPFYYTNVDVDPTDSDVVWVNNVTLWRSTDGGRSWGRIPTPHVDNHDIWIDPSNTDLIVQGNDGGANVSRDGGRTWSTQLNQPTAEMYQVATDDRFPYRLWGGQQDREIVSVPSLPVASELPEISYGGGTCETGPAVPKPDDSNVVYSACKGRFMVWDRRTAELRHHYVGAVYMYGHAAADLQLRFQRVSPVEVSPHDPDVVYHGSQYVHRTRDGGVTWETISPDLTARPPGTQGISGEPITRDITGEEVYSTLYAIKESPLVPGVIWVGSYDGPFHVTRDGGVTWTDITPPAQPPGGRVQSIDPSPHRPGTAYYSVLRFMLDDWRPYVWRTDDYGRTWTRLTTGENGIPADYPVRVVREDPERPGLLYAGAEFGFYVSFDDGAHWQPLQLDLPAVPVTDIRVRGNDVVISTMGRGFWILRDVSPLRQLSAQVVAARRHLFRPAATARFVSRPPRVENPGEPESPRPGAVVDWYMASGPSAPITVELIDEDGSTINGWSSDHGGYTYVRSGGMRGGEVIVRGGPRVPDGPGHNRFRVPLQHMGPWSASGGEHGAGGLEPDGPAVAPGSYRVRVTAGAWSATEPLTVVTDPRVRDIGVGEEDLREQERLALRVRDLLSRARRAADRVERALTATGGEDRERGRRLRAIRNLLLAEEGIAYPQPMLVDQVDYLYDMVDRPNQKPAGDAYRRHDELVVELERVEEMLDAAGVY